MSRIYWDTMLFAYLLERHPTYQPIVRGIYSQMLHRGDELCTSSLTLGELLVLPRRTRDEEHAKAIVSFFCSDYVKVLPFTHEYSVRFAEIRADYGTRPTDTIHLATAAEYGVDLFLTNDRAIKKLKISGIQFFDDVETTLFRD